MDSISIWGILGIVLVVGVLLVINFTSGKTKDTMPIAGGCAPVIDPNKHPFAPVDEDEPAKPTNQL